MGMRPLSETQAARGSKQPRSKLWGIISGRVLHGGCLSWPKTLIRSGISREGRNRFLLPTFSEDHISPFTSERRRRQATAVWRTGVDTFRVRWQPARARRDTFGHVFTSIGCQTGHAEPEQRCVQGKVPSNQVGAAESPDVILRPAPDVVYSSLPTCSPAKVATWCPFEVPRGTLYIPVTSTTPRPTGEYAVVVAGVTPSSTLTVKQGEPGKGLPPLFRDT